MITVVIPTRSSNPDVDVTVWSLLKQTYKDFKMVIVPDQGKGANWARNEGFKSVDTEYVLFSDDDINWEKDAIDCMVWTLDKHPDVSYVYGSWVDQRGELSFEEFDAEELKKHNYISTMTLIRTKDFPGFDERIKRLQDWDCWLEMLSKGKIGMQCGKRIFTTVSIGGITEEGTKGYQEAKQIILKKHGL
jgi:hypothetical protein